MRIFREAKELKKKQELEDAKNQASDQAVNKLIYNDGEFEKIQNDIINILSNQKKDKFTKKFSFVTCN